MGCINSKNLVAGDSPVHSKVRTDNGSAIVEPPSRSRSGMLASAGEGDRKSEDCNRDGKKSGKDSSKGSGIFSFKMGLSHRIVEAELNAAGWPPWLTAAAGEAIHGWVPLRADSFEKLEKIGQGTYSSVFRAREVETGRMFALKKVRFDNFQPESVRFMSREITILRRLDHPNIMKLEGVITSRLSSSIYLVFEYMEHDLAGLVSCPDITFSDSQVKCYMRQLLSGLEHCHLRGIIHRDIKVSNILVNNDGILKIGDFGLANTISSSNKHPLTSRVVTLWYRPPELLMGSTNYGVSVDLWSVGCVFGELFLGKPILKGRTEVEQLHKIFKLCGSPPDEFWKKCKLPHATMFKPQITYESSLSERFLGIPETALNLMQTLLSVDPRERGTASSALMSEYFSTKPFACDPSSLPKYPPNKEMDAKNREEVRRKKTDGKAREAATSRKQRREKQNNSQKVVKDDVKSYLHKGKGEAMQKEPSKPSIEIMSQTSQINGVPRGFSILAGPAPASGASGFAWAKRRKPEVSSTLSDGSKSKISALDPTFAKGTYNLTRHVIDVAERKFKGNTGHQTKSGQPEHIDASDTYSNLSTNFDSMETPDSVTDTQGHEKLGHESTCPAAGKSRLGR
ncbi:cyclin-dependent kinase C-2 C-like isoform X2 [Prosopis cineraria]|uniref:cyclin-dependent kinase C-2 C-like isoform X2 n=1 Tax=Prosopis cineraria TaxID=364024 RepID=UPI0024109D05|nr:cyclin-dependent kinase C-2 C-like isoform X2 [Prosopis cineraria]